MRSLFALALFAGATPALADPATDPPAFDRPTQERVSDGFGMGLSAGGGAIVGGFAGGTIAALTCDQGDDDFFGFECLGRALLGIGGGAIGGFIGGALIFDTVSDGDGSLWAMAGGAVIGLAGGIGLASIDEIEGVAWVAIPLLTAGGAGLGYALFDSPQSAPSVAVLPDGQGGARLSAALSGTF